MELVFVVLIINKFKIEVGLGMDWDLLLVILINLILVLRFFGLLSISFIVLILVKFKLFELLKLLNERKCFLKFLGEFGRFLND